MTIKSFGLYDHPSIWRILLAYLENFIRADRRQITCLPGRNAAGEVDFADLAHIVEEFAVSLELIHQAEHSVHGLERRKVGEKLAENPGTIQGILIEKEIIAASTGKHHIDGRENPSVS